MILFIDELNKHLSHSDRRRIDSTRCPNAPGKRNDDSLQRKQVAELASAGLGEVKSGLAPDNSKIIREKPTAAESKLTENRVMRRYARALTKRLSSDVGKPEKDADTSNTFQYFFLLWRFWRIMNMTVRKVIHGKTVAVSPEDAYLLNSENWYWDKNGYLKRTIYLSGYKHPESEYLHRVIHPPRPGYQVDHIDRDKSNNTRQNLRDLLPGQNALNRGKGTSELGLKGVTRHKAKYRAQAQIVALNLYLRTVHDTPEEAAYHRDVFMREHAPDIAFLNYDERKEEYDWIIAVRHRFTIKTPYFMLQRWENELQCERLRTSESESQGNFDKLPEDTVHSQKILSKHLQLACARFLAKLRPKYSTTKAQLREAVTLKLKESLANKTLSVRILAEELNISKSRIQRLTERNTPVALETLFALGRYFEIAYKFEYPAHKEK